MADKPALTSKAESEAKARQAREASALRENLKRRKAQARARDGQPAYPDETDAPKIG